MKILPDVHWRRRRGRRRFPPDQHRFQSQRELANKLCIRPGCHGDTVARLSWSARRPHQELRPIY
jgi:hypothetical protein